MNLKIKNIYTSGLTQKSIKHIRAQAYYIAARNNYKHGSYIHVIIEKIIYRIKYDKKEVHNIFIPPSKDVQSFFFYEILSGNTINNLELLYDIFPSNIRLSEVFLKEVSLGLLSNYKEEVSAILIQMMDNPLIVKFPSQNNKNNNEDYTKDFSLFDKALRSIISWSKSGFSTVDEETLIRREEACLSCPYMKGQRSNMSEVVSSQNISNYLKDITSNMICGLDNTQIRIKARQLSGCCPDTRIIDPGLTRWGESYKYKELVLS